MAHLAWVTGAGGLIGSHIASSAARFAPGWKVRALTRAELNLCDFGAVTKAFTSDAPEVVIHCAAISKSPVCEADPAAAWQINTRATEHLAELVRKARVILFSSDLVFDGRQGRYAEDAAVGPLSVYAETKAAAEQAVLSNPRHAVIRASLNAGPSPTGDRGFDEQLRLAWERGDKPRLFTDEFRSPIAASVTARVVWEIVTNELSGLFHVAGAQRLSRWEIGRLLAERYPHLKPEVEPASLQSYKGPPRPPDTSLDCRKIQSHLSFELPGFADWLQTNTPDRSGNTP